MPAASVRAAAAAVAFLTRLPVVPRRLELDAADVGRGALLFPIVGAGGGALAGLAAAGLEGPLPPLLAGAIAVLVMLVLTGALHLDALADTADALGARSREQALEIMRDPRIGSFGAAAVAAAVLVESEAAGTLAHAGQATAAFAVAGALSRAAALPLALLLPYARAEPGPGSVLSGRVSGSGTAIAVALAVGLALLLVGWKGAVAAGAAAGLTASCGLGFRGWLGGVTGDALGAVTQLTEVAVLVLLVGIL
jgi:adenosylcobinamide-GDP ribazoletransferase